MYPRILHLYGPMWINSYGLMIALGFLLFVYFTAMNPRREKLLSIPKFLDALFIGLLCGIIGGRILFVIENFNEFRRSGWLEAFYPWVGGFSLLGTMIAILIVMPFYLRWHKVKILPFLDLVTIYAPLLQSIARIGCFLAGCCYGKVASKTLKWAVCYTHHDCLSPLCVRLHPTQLYSSIASFIIFLIIRFIISTRAKKVGQIAFSYLILESAARFVVDFWRGDRGLVNLGIKSLNKIFSFYQILALILFVVSIFGMIWVSKKGKKIKKR